MLDVDTILRPWWDHLRTDLNDPALFDAHTHIGDSDPDGARQTPEQLIAALERVPARAVVFPMHEPAVREIVALAHERRVPVLIHAGRGIPALGRDTVRLSGEFTDAPLILAHAAISNLAWLWRVLPEHQNLFVDTTWWDPSDLMALFTLAPPG